MIKSEELISFMRGCQTDHKLAITVIEDWIKVYLESDKKNRKNILKNLGIRINWLIKTCCIAV